MITLEQVVARVREADAKLKDDPAAPPLDQLARVVMATIAACGLDVNPHTGEVYNPAEGSYRPPEKKPFAPADNSRRLHGGRRGR